MPKTMVLDTIADKILIRVCVSLRGVQGCLPAVLKPADEIDILQHNDASRYFNNLSLLMSLIT